MDNLLTSSSEESTETNFFKTLSKMEIFMSSLLLVVLILLVVYLDTFEINN